MNTIEKLNALKWNNMIIDIKGTVIETPRIGTICWARSNPKKIFEYMGILNKYISPYKFVLIVDDMCPKTIYGRSEEEQEDINQKYIDSFTDYDIYFSSEILKKGNNSFMTDFITFMSEINFNYYLDFLPQKKRENFANINLGEFLHTFFELYLIKYAEKNMDISTLIFGKFSQNIMFLQSQISRESKLSYLIIPRLSDEEITNTAKKMQNIF